MSNNFNSYLISRGGVVFMKYAQELIEEIRVQNDIVDVISGYITLKQRGSSYFGLCPFHNESHPSFSVSADKQLFHCFGCGISGNVYSFIMQIENFDFLDAVKLLADRANIHLPDGQMSLEAKKASQFKQRLFDIHKKAARFYYDFLNSPSGVKATNYLVQRKISKKTQIKFGLGFSPRYGQNLYSHLRGLNYSDEEMLGAGLIVKSKKNNGYYDRFFDRLMFPIIDVYGNIIGFGGRIIDKGEPKYLNSPETIVFDKSKCLYGLNFARTSRKNIIVVEGYMDLIMLNQAGFSNVVATLGTAFSQFHARLIKKYSTEIVLLFDSDEAGEKAALRTIPILLSNGIKARVLTIPNAKDPDEFIKKFGSDEFNKLLLHADSHISFQVNCIRKRYDINNIEQRVMFTNEVSTVLSEVQNAIEQDAYIKDISELTNISVRAIKQEIEKTTINHDKVQIINNDTTFSPPSVINKKITDNNNNNNASRGLLEAQYNLLRLIGTDYNVYIKISEFITPSEFTLPIYQKLAEILFELNKNEKNIYAAEIVSYFEDINDQKYITDIFSTDVTYENVTDLEKSINDQLKIIKKSHLDDKIRNTDNLQELQKLLLDKRNLDNLYITLIDG